MSKAKRTVTFLVGAFLVNYLVWGVPAGQTEMVKKYRPLITRTANTLIHALSRSIQ